MTAEARMGPVRVGTADRGVAVSAAQPGQRLVRRARGELSAMLEASSYSPSVGGVIWLLVYPAGSGQSSAVPGRGP